LVIVVIATRLWQIPYGRELGITLTATFLLLEFWRAPGLQRNMGGAMFLIGGVAAWYGGDLVGGLLTGLDRAQIFLVMFYAVTWLREPAVTSGSLRELRDWVVRQPAGRRYPILWLSAHFLGSVLNLAAMSLLSIMAGEQKDKLMRKRLSIALMMGFTVASTWGPFYVSVAVILTAIPGVSWADIAPQGLLLSFILLFVGWGYDRAFLRQTPTVAAPLEKPVMHTSSAVRTSLLLIALSVLVLGLHELAKLPIPIALGVVGPPFAILWAAMQLSKGQRWRNGARPLIGRIFKSLPDLRNEAIAFSAASVLGIGVSSVLPPEQISATLQTYGLSGDVVIVGLIYGMTVASAAGFHPVIVAILVGEVMPPEVIGMPPEILAMALLGVWGASTMISPFSATTLFMSRVVQTPSHVIAWKWDIPVVLLAITVVAVYVVTYKHIFY
jgi:hypothetical protein